MPKLIIDTIPVTVPDGTSVLQAAQAAGIPVPHFCWHPALGKAGACRVCAVKIIDGPVKGIQMSCMLPAADGMVVSTTDDEAVALRRQVIEWLMINHPHDCPVCDEGGECLLQEYTIAGNHGIRRYQGKKRTHVNQELGPFIQHEMNRCIQCYRCVRFYQEFAGGTDFGVLGSAGRVYYGRFSEGPLESPFSGNLADICPTGVFTDKTARFRARYWDYDMAPSVCPACSIGCFTTPVGRYRELLKIKARLSSRVNGWFICDRGRFCGSGVNDPERPRTPLVDSRTATMEEALDDLIIRIGQIQDLHGPRSVALTGSSRLTLEANLLLAELAGLLGCELCYFTDREQQERTVTAVGGMTSATTITMAEIEQADCIAIVDTDLLDEGPMLALAVRQSWRRGAAVFLIGRHAPLSQMETLTVEAVQLEYAEEVPFGVFDRPVIICGTRNSDAATIRTILASGYRTFCLLSGPNAFATALLTMEYTTRSLEMAVTSGTIKGVVSFEPSSPENLPENVHLLAVADWQRSPAADRAGIFLPTTAWVEMDGTYLNNEGRARRFRQVMQPGLPIRGLDPAQHPPRIHSSTAPGSEPQPAAQLIAELIRRISGEPATDIFTGKWAQLRNLDPESDGIRILNE